AAPACRCRPHGPGRRPRPRPARPPTARTGTNGSIRSGTLRRSHASKRSPSIRSIMAGGTSPSGRWDNRRVTGRLYLGTSGFAYDEWKGPFYPAGLKQKDMLPYYASRFGSVEINYTFRQQPTEKTLATWRDATPVGFLITLKAHQRITHWLRLADADEAVSNFLDRARSLGPRLGVILFQ